MLAILNSPSVSVVIPSCSSCPLSSVIAAVAATTLGLCVVAALMFPGAFSSWLHAHIENSVNPSSNS